MRLRSTLATGVALSLIAAAAAQAQEACDHGPYAADTYRPTPAFEGQTNAPAAEPSAVTVETIASGLDHPWAIAFLPEGGMLVTERPGAMRIISADGDVSAPIANVPDIQQASLSGLTDVVLAPDFAESRVIYFNYVTLAPGAEEAGRNAPGVGRTVRARLSDDGTELEDLEVLRLGTGAPRRLVWAPDGTLFITSGTGIVSGPEPRAVLRDEGKVLRINADGSVPRDNPFLGLAGALPDLYSIGHRDPEGAAIDPATGDLWTVEHGPRGGDELNRIRPGGDYGHGVISYGREYDETLINDGLTAREGLEQPVYFWTPSIGPSGLAFYTGDLFPEWRGDLFVGSMPLKHLVRLEMEDGRVVAEEKLLGAMCARIRFVEQGPDGALYVLTDADDGQLLRLTPAE